MTDAALVEQIAQVASDAMAGNVEQGTLVDLRVVARAVLARLRERGLLVPPGWQAVPKEPTPKMVETGDVANPTSWEDGTPDEFGSEVAMDVYAAMLAAAPKPGEGE